jgi:hypothetical protein
MEAKILRSNHDSLFIETSGGGEMVVPRSEVTDIDHPGNVVAVVGGAIGGYGLLNIAVGLSHCDTMGAAYCTGVFTPAAVGIPMLIYGLVVWNDSKDAAAGKAMSASADLPLMIAPMAAQEGDKQYTGAALVGSF